MRLVSETDLVLTMAERIAERANIWFGNQLLKAPFTAPKIDAFLYWHDNVDSDPGNRWLRHMVEHAVADAPPDSEATF